MKIKRYKKVSKALNFYINNFGFRQPFQILVDGTFCLAALKNQINIADNLPRYLQGEIKLLTTPCAIIEMEKLGYKLLGALNILKQYALHKCNHEKEPITASNCFVSMLDSHNSKHYIIATQDRELQQCVRDMSAVPLLYLHGKAPILEQPSALSLQLVRDKTNLDWNERMAIKDMKRELDILDESETITPSRKKRKTKGPNPLSCKKKQRKIVVQVKRNRPTSSVPVVRKKGRKMRIPKHIKEELFVNKKQ